MISGFLLSWSLLQKTASSNDNNNENNNKKEPVSVRFKNCVVMVARKVTRFWPVYLAAAYCTLHLNDLNAWDPGVSGVIIIFYFVLNFQTPKN